MDSALTNERDALIDAIRLPEEAVKGLVPIQIQQMKETAVGVNEAVGVAGRAIRSSCEQLFALKKNLKHGNWTAFIKSGVLDLSAKQAGDWVSAYENWLAQDVNVPDSVLAAMTARTAAAIGNSKPETRSEVMGKLLSGTKPSEAEVRKIIREAEGGRKVKLPLRGADLDAMQKSLTKEQLEKANKRLVEDLDEAKEENKELKAEVARLNKLLNAVK